MCAGWPSLRPAALHRKTPASTWELASSSEGQQATIESLQGEGGSIDALARDDPLQGLLLLGLLPLCCKVLQPGGRAPAVLLPLLSVLLALARSSAELAEGMARCAAPGSTDASPPVARSADASLPVAGFCLPHGSAGW